MKANKKHLTLPPLCFFCIFLLTSCKTTQIPTPIQSVTDTLAIISYNDFHGAFVEDGKTPGAARLVQSVLDEKERHPNNIVVSAGDNFSGSYFSRITRGEPLPAIMKKMDVALSAVGNHEFDWGINYLKDTAALYTEFISANITTDGYKNIHWIKPYKIINQKLKNDSILKIAFIGLTTTETAHKTRPENINGLQFINPLAAASIQTLYELKKEGELDMIVLLTHIGTDMAAEDIIVDRDSKILPYMEKIDAIISGHSHKIVLDQRNLTPIIQAGVNGSHIGKLLFEIKETGDENQKYNITYISGDTIAVQSNSNPEIKYMVAEYINKYKFDEVLTTANKDYIHDRNINKFEYTPVGALVTSSYVDCFTNKNKEKANKQLPVIGVNHFGGIRTGIAKGDVTRLRAGNILPFGGNIVAHQITGKQLKELLQEGRNNKNGYLQSSNIALQLANDKISKVYWITPKNKKQEIKDKNRCIVVLDEFITNGGDGYNKDLFKTPVKLFNNQKNETTNALIEYLGKLKSISSESISLPIITQ